MKNHCLMRRLLGVFVGSLLPFIVACTGTSVGNPPGAQVQLGVVGTADENTPTAPQQGVGPLGGGIVINEAWISLGHFQLNSVEQCAGGGSPDVSGIFAVNLIDNEMMPSRPVWERDRDELYCALSAQIEPLAQPIEGLPAALSEAPVYVEGVRGDGIPFRISVSMEEPLRLEPLGKNEFELQDNLDAFLVEFNLNAWMNAGELAKAEPKDGWVVANATENAEVAKNMRARIGSSARLLRDKDKNGKFNAGDEEL